MKITFYFVGKTRDRRIFDLVDDYTRALSRFVEIDIKVTRQARGGNAGEIARREGQDLLKAMDRGERGFRVGLDAAGRALPSEGLAAALAKWMEAGGARVVFVVGGEEGLSPDVLLAMDERLSLSKMTFPHELCRVMLAEQVYRAVTILRGTGYHR